MTPEETAGFVQYQAIGPISGVTVVTAHIEAAVRRYTHGLGWHEVADRSVIEGSTAERWGWPGLKGRLTAEVGSGVPDRATIRLVSVPEVEPIVPLRTWGWSAIELSVPDVCRAVGRAQDAGFRLLQAPAALSGAGTGGHRGAGTGVGEGGPTTLPLVAAQLAGPDGDVVYLTQVLGEVPGFELPAPSESAEIFICVFAARDLPAAREVLESRFAVRRASDREVAVKVINARFGLSAQTMHRISSIQLAGRNAIEFDQYPRQAEPRRSSGKWPPAAVLVVSVVGSGDPQVVQLPHGAVLDVEARKPTVDDPPRSQLGHDPQNS